ncbi:MAG: hypothetical protein K2X35_21690 [Bryobacteraceae bacterium]|nr:hypothetical protein [Bryobacteraceae bacterium]
MMTAVETPERTEQMVGKVYCPMCTHTVDADLEPKGKRFQVKPGQRCARCKASLDAGYIMWMQPAA